MNTLRVERTSAADLSALAELEQNCFSVPWSAETLKEMLADTQSLMLVAKEKGHVVGALMLSLVPDLPPLAEILRIAVLPSARRQGVAQSLLIFGESELKEKGIGRILLEVRASNAPAIGLYVKNGFTQITIRKGYYEHPKEDAWIYEKKLSEENR